MGASLQWRQPPERENHLHSDVVEFGRGRSRGTGHLVHADRVGPGVLLLDPTGYGRADVLGSEGFTILAPDVPEEGDREAILDAAADFLTANWHPRLGVIAVGAPTAHAASALLRGRVSIDVLALHDCLWTDEALPRVPIVAHFSAACDPDAIRSRFAADGGQETELYVYEATREGFCEPRSGAFAPDASALADARTLDAFEYHLS